MMIHARIGTLASLTVTLAGVAACGAQPDNARVSVRDSAGVRIVESASPAWEPGSEWRLSPEPSLMIGLQDGDPEYLFHGIVGARFLSDGGIAVGDYASNQIRYYDADGEFLRSAGREGDGPGEFRFMSLLWLLPGDTVAVSDSRGLTLFDPAGRYVRSVRLETGVTEFGGQAVAQLHDGTILGMNGTRGFRPDRLGELQADTLEFHAYAADGSWITRLDGMPSPPIWVVTGTTSMRRVPFIAYPVRGAGRSFHLSNGQDAAIATRTADGTISRIIRWRPPSLALTADQIERYREYSMDRASTPESRRVIAQFLDEVPLPDTRPALGEAAFVIDPSGNLWAEAYRVPWEPEPEWLVFSPDGEWLGAVGMPAGFVLHDVATDRVLGAWRDELQVERILVYDIVRP